MEGEGLDFPKKFETSDTSSVTQNPELFLLTVNGKNKIWSHNVAMTSTIPKLEYQDRTLEDSKR